MSIVRAFVLVFAAAWLSGCATTLTPAAYRTFDAESASEGELDFHGLPLQSGQLVVSDSGEADSLLMSMLGEEYTPYGHAGILSIESGKAYVYEGYALLWPFLSGPPTDAMRGRIRRVPLDEYIERQRITSIFDPGAGIDKDAVVVFARARHDDGTQFDPYFDWRDHTRLYCTEFAALMRKDVPVYCIKEDLADRGLLECKLLEGIVLMSRAQMPRLFGEYDQVWKW